VLVAMKVIQGITHSFRGIFHTLSWLNKGSEQGFYQLSTVLTRGYYYYLYIYKTHFQADQLLITVQPLLLPNTTTMSARATA
jgi:hypothetical protein